MITPDEHLMIGLKAMERLRPGFLKRLGQVRGWMNPSLPGNSPLVPTPGEAASPGLPGAAPAAVPAQPSLQAVLQNLQPLAASNGLLGICDDNLPFLLDLSNPAPGSVLVAGDPDSGQARLIQSFLSSLVLLNSPKQVIFSILTAQPEAYRDLASANHCQRLLAASDPATGELLKQCADLLDTRRYGKPHGPILVLVLDDLAACLAAWSEAQENLLLRLVRHGPRSRIWVMASFSTAILEAHPGWLDEHARLLAGFRTRLTGSLANPQLTTWLTGLSVPPPILATPGACFFTPYGAGWMQFSICDPLPLFG